jgi:hypothetical protein
MYKHALDQLEISLGFLLVERQRLDVAILAIENILKDHLEEEQQDSFEEKQPKLTAMDGTLIPTKIPDNLPEDLPEKVKETVEEAERENFKPPILPSVLEDGIVIPQHLLDRSRERREFLNAQAAKQAQAKV